MLKLTAEQHSHSPDVFTLKGKSRVCLLWVLLYPNGIFDKSSGCSELGLRTTGRLVALLSVLSLLTVPSAAPAQRCSASWGIRELSPGEANPVCVRAVNHLPSLVLDALSGVQRMCRRKGCAHSCVALHESLWPLCAHFPTMTCAVPCKAQARWAQRCGFWWALFCPSSCSLALGSCHCSMGYPGHRAPRFYIKCQPSRVSYLLQCVKD